MQAHPGGFFIAYEVRQARHRRRCTDCATAQPGVAHPPEARAKHYLRIGYYRLAGYSLPLQIDYKADGSHRFLDGVNFDDVLDLYSSTVSCGWR